MSELSDRVLSVGRKMEGIADDFGNPAFLAGAGLIAASAYLQARGESALRAYPNEELRACAGVHSDACAGIERAAQTYIAGYGLQWVGVPLFLVGIAQAAKRRIARNNINHPYRK